MPTYTVYVPAGFLSSEQRSVIAGEVTRTHNDVTGAPALFAQVLFVDIADGSWFVGAAALESGQIYIHGHVRGGRCAEMKRRLVLGLRDALASGAGLPTNRVWSCIAELPPAQMMEYGHVLPEPGGEAAWLQALPPEDRAMMESAGRG